MSEQSTRRASADERRKGLPTISLRLLLILTTAAGCVFAWWLKREEHLATARQKIVPITWDVGTRENVVWSALTGSQSYSSPAWGSDRIVIGSNNGANLLPQHGNKDLGLLQCFDAATGTRLWAHASPKLAVGRVSDWPMQGVTATPTVEGDRVWYMSSRGEIVCLDLAGFHDGENDGITTEASQTLMDADVVWKRDLRADFGTHPHNTSAGGCVIWRDRLFFVMPNGVDESHTSLPNQDGPAFMCLDKATGELLWKDHSSSPGIMHGQWATPATARLGGRQQAIFPGGDGWLYSFDAVAGDNGEPQLLWKFDCNLKDAVWKLGGQGNRNNLLQAPVIHDGLVYIATGQDPEHGVGQGRLVCVDPSKRGDVSSELVLTNDGAPAPVRRFGVVEDGERIVPNPNSALVWEYTGLEGSEQSWSSVDLGELPLAASKESGTLSIPKGGERFSRSLSRVAIQDGLLVVSDMNGFVHGLDAKSGRVFWVDDTYSAVWSSPVIAGEHIYVGDEDGEMRVLPASRDASVVAAGARDVLLPDSIYGTPLVHNNVLYLATRREIYAIAAPQKGTQ